MMISLIIPILNEAARIDALLFALEQLEGDCEILFVDGGSTDGCTDRIPPKYRLIAAPKGRAKQQNAGAAAATGEVLCFLHSDSIPGSDMLPRISESIRISPAGCMTLRFDSPSLLMKICAKNSNLRVKWRNIAFGDQGIFLTRSLFDEIGGFHDIPLMEDYQLSMDIKARKIRIRQIPTSITTSARRYEQGALRTMARMQKYQHQYRRGIDPALIAKAYKDER